MILTKVKNEIGATAIEYGILSALIAVATITGIQLTGVNLDKTYCYIATKVSQASGGTGGGGCSGSSSNPANKSESNANDSDSISPVDLKNPSAFYPEFDFVSSLVQNGIVSLTGIYGSDGHPITTVSDLVTYVGIKQATLDKLNEDFLDSREEGINEIYNTGKHFYTDIPNATMTDSNGVVYTGKYLQGCDADYVFYYGPTVQTNQRPDYQFQLENRYDND